MKKLNWGHKLTFFMLAFMLFIIVMVYQISVQKVDLVDENYYERGMLYQSDINKYAASKEVPHELSYNNTVKLLLFKVNDKQTFAGTLTLYRPNDASLDVTVPFQLDSLGCYTYQTSNLKKGVWKATFEWTFGGKLMATEKQILLL
jgi:hypothetical protein